MNRNVKIKTAVIAAVILVCLYGIIGIPKSKDELVANWHKNIHLGLDLSGGTQLVMQVQLQDAFKAFADNTIERLRLELQKDGIPTSGDLTRNDPMTLEDADKIQIEQVLVNLIRNANHGHHRTQDQRLGPGRIVRTAHRAQRRRGGVAGAASRRRRFRARQAIAADSSGPGMG